MINHVYKAEEWKAGNGKWYCADVSSLSRDSSTWWYPCNILELSPVEYVKLLKNKFNASNFHYRTQSDVLLFSFDSQQDCRRYKNYINKIAREKHFVTY